MSIHSSYTLYYIADLIRSPLYALHGLVCVQYIVKFCFRAGLLKSLMLQTTMTSLLLLLPVPGVHYSPSRRTQKTTGTLKVGRARLLRQVLVEQVGVPAKKAK